MTFLTGAGQVLSQIYGMDSVIINQLMYGIRGNDGEFTNGYVQSMETKERWGWHKEQLEAFEHDSLVAWASKKFGTRHPVRACASERTRAIPFARARTH